MSSNSLKYLLIIVLLLLQGCSTSFFNSSKEPEVKQYDKENLYILTALEYESYNDVNDYKKAIKLYEDLEKHTNKFEYMQKAIALSLHIKDIKNAQKLADRAVEKYPSHQLNLYKLQSYIYLTQSNIDKAIEVTLKAIKQYPNDYELYEIAGSLYFQKKEYEKAKNYYESSYSKQKNTTSLLNLSNILYTYLDKKVDAISYLETHSRLYKYDPKIYAKLINIYSEQKDYQALANTYDRMYQHTHKEYYALKVVEIYIQTNKKEDAIKYLQKNNLNNLLLLDLYKEKKDYKKAVKLARKLYKKNKDVDLLAQIAMMEYELYITPTKVKSKKLNKKSKKKLRNIVANMKYVISKKETPSYLNYLGYVLIDNNLAIRKGIKYIKKSLKNDPNNPYYLDSLAWGYYKLGACKSAKKLMKKVVRQIGTENEEVRYHLHQINRCR